MNRHLSVIINKENSGVTVLDFLASRYTYRDRASWREEIASDRFFLNRKKVENGETVLAPGDLLVYHLGQEPEPAVSFAITVLFEDSDVLVLDKPGNLPCHPGGRFFNNTLWAWLKEVHGMEKPFLVNRLDRETSGVVLVAKNGDVARDLCAQFSAHSVDKGYLAIVEGRFPSGDILATGFLEKDRQSVVRKKLRFVDAGQPVSADALFSVTSFKRLAVRNGLSLVEARPETGRTHQIRATLFSLGFPVTGDKLYGVDENFYLKFIQNLLTEQEWNQLRLNRQALHSASLAFVHPATGRRMEISSPLPGDMALVFQDSPVGV